MVGHVATVGQNAGDLHEVVLSREEFRGEELVVADRAVRAVEADVERVRHLSVEHGRRPADLAVRKLDVDGDGPRVFDGVLRLHLVGAYLPGFAAGEPAHRIHRMATAGEDGRAAVFAAAQPFLFRRHPDPVHVVHLDHEDVAERPLVDQSVDGHEQRVPVQHEAHECLDAVLPHGPQLLSQVLYRQCHRLFDNHVLAGFGRRHDVSRV